MEPDLKQFANPFKPGAGHMPPYLAGREEEKIEFLKLLDQKIILENLILTGLRGVGKTVLLDTFKPLAISKRWLWAGTDLSESASISEEAMALRLITDLSVVTSSVVVNKTTKLAAGFIPKEEIVESKLNYEFLTKIYSQIPGLAVDKIKGILEFVWTCIKDKGLSGIIFAYDEAQILTDNSEKQQFPLSLLLDSFQSIQKKNIPFMLVLTGLPTLFPNLVETRTYSERMFKIVFLNSLSDQESRDAISKPTEMGDCPKFDEKSIKLVMHESGGYPYFIQFICKEIYDIFLQKISAKQSSSVPIHEITKKLDRDFFAGRWARATDRQRQLLAVIAKLEKKSGEFTLQEVAECSKKYLKNPFGSSQINQMLSSLSKNGIIYKNRHGKYSFAVPLLDRFILRILKENPSLIDGHSAG